MQDDKELTRHSSDPERSPCNYTFQSPSCTPPRYYDFPLPDTHIGYNTSDKHTS